MVRTQIQLTETQADGLKKIAAAEILGRFASGKSDISSNHDSYLAEAFSE